MAKVDLSNLNSSTIQCTKAEYNALADKKTNVLYVITDAASGESSLYMNEKSLANDISTEDVTPVKGVDYFTPTEIGDIKAELIAHCDTYIDDSLGTLNEQLQAVLEGAV